MKKIFIIIYNPSLDSETLRAKIKAQGRSFTFWNNHWLVECTLDAKSLYEKIVGDEFEKESILVAEFKIEQNSYWGRMDKKLWDWLKNE